MFTRLASSALLAVFAIPATAHATTTYFTYVPVVGTTVHFTLDSLDAGQPDAFTSGISAAFLPVRCDYTVTMCVALFVNTSFSNSFYGESFDFTFGTLDGAIGGAYDGPQLYTGDEGAPQFIPGTYLLEPTQVFGPVAGAVPATLIISRTPEPSSLLFFGTGIVATWGAVRRRSKRSTSPWA